MTTIICPHCGKDVSEEATVCPSCGGTLELPTPVAEESVELPVKKGAPLWWRIVRCIFSIPLTVLLVAALLAFTVLSAARHIPKVSTVKSLFDEVKPTQLIAEALTEGETNAIAAVIYEGYEQAATESGLEVLTQDELQAVLESSTLDDFLTNKASAYLTALLNGETDVAVTKGELLDLIRENEAVIEQATDGRLTLTDEHYAMLEDAIDESGIVEQLDMSILIPEEELPALDTLQLVYNEAFYAAIALCLVLVLLIGLFNLCGHFLTSLYSGIALLLSGTIATLTLAVEALAADIIATSGLPFSANVLSAIVHTVLSGFWKTGLCLVIGGILCIALFVVMGILRRHRQKA